jgi:hypothetical protein
LAHQKTYYLCIAQLIILNHIPIQGQYLPDYFLYLIRSADLSQALFFEDSFGCFICGNHFVKDFFGSIAADFPCLHHLDQTGQIFTFYRDFIGISIFQDPQQFNQNPVCSILWINAKAYNLFKITSQGFISYQDIRFIFTQAILTEEPILLLFRQFWKMILYFLYCHAVKDDREKVRLGEIPVVMGILLGAHGYSFSFAAVPFPGLLNNLVFLAELVQLFLPLFFLFQCLLDFLKGIQVLDFHLCTELFLPCFSNGNIHITPQGTLFHPAVGYLRVFQYGFQCLQECSSLLR